MPGIDEHFGRATVENLGKNLINNAIPAPVNAAIHSANDSNNLSSAGTGGESMDNNMSGTGENSSHATGEGIGEVPMDAIIVAPTSLATRQAEDGTKTPSVSMAKTTPIGTNKTLRQVPETSPTPAKSSVKLRKDAHTRRMPNVSKVHIHRISNSSQILLDTDGGRRILPSTSQLRRMPISDGRTIEMSTRLP